MVFVIAALGTFFILCGLVVTEKNAKYILAGYNTMSDEERAKFDIKRFIRFFRRFHLFLGASFLIFGLTLIPATNDQVVNLFVTFYIIAAYLYLVLRSLHFVR